MPSSHSTIKMIAMVSNMRRLQSSLLRKCKLSAALALVLGAGVSAAAQDNAAAPAQPNGQRAVETVKFLTGGGLAFLEHEADHWLFDAVFDAHPYLKTIHFGAIPFFAVAHQPVSPRREFVVSSAGFWTQFATSEWMLTK